MKTVKVVFERGEDGWWTVSVPSVSGCLTQGRTIEEGRRNVRDALGMFPEDGWTAKAAAAAEIEEEVRVPESAKAAIAQASLSRNEAAEAEARAKETMIKAVRELAGEPLRLSTRDAAALLGLSGQRVAQLLAEDVGDARRARHEAPTRKAVGRLVSTGSAAARRARKRD